jgi:DNA integrity scanning protein DisA with diadenylate cyclase activity
MLLRLFFYTYWCIYIKNKKTSRRRSVFSAVILITLLVFLNVMFLFRLFTGIMNMTIIYSIFFVILIINFLYVRRFNFEELEKKYLNERKISKWLSLLFLLLLLALAILLSIIDFNSHSSTHLWH